MLLGGLYTDNNADTDPNPDGQSMIVKALRLINQMSQKLYWKIEKNTGKVREICQSEKVGTMYELRKA